MAGCARPVRMVANSSLATATAFSIFSSASRRLSSITVAPAGRCRLDYRPPARGPVDGPGWPARALAAASPPWPACVSRRWPSSPSLAHLEPGERLNAHTGAGQYLLDGALGVLHEG